MQVRFQSEVVYMVPETSNADTVTLPGKTDDNAVFGRGGVMDYVMTIRMPFNKGATDIKTRANEARGKRVDMSRAPRIELFLPIK